VKSHHVQPVNQAFSHGQALLSAQRVERERLRVAKLEAEQKLRELIAMVEDLEEDVERADKRLRAAELRIGETRAHLRANGLF